MVGTLAPQATARQPAEFIVNYGNQRFTGVLVAPAPIGEQFADLYGPAPCTPPPSSHGSTGTLGQKVAAPADKVNFRNSKEVTFGITIQNT